MKKYMLLLLLITLFQCTPPALPPTALNTGISTLATEETEKKIQELLDQMTLKEKVGQMLNIGIPSILTGGYWDTRDSIDFHPEKFHKFLVDYGVGSIHNTPGFIPTKEQWTGIIKTIQDTAMQKSRLGIPVLYGIDNIHGANYVNKSVIFPHQIGLAATWNPSLAELCGKITSYESRAASMPWNFNPNVDVATNPLWGRIGESFGEDPLLISELSAAYIKGSQNQGLQSPTSTAVCLKHYLGYGAGNNGKDRANAIIPENNLRQYFLPPFENGIKNGAMGVMISSNAINGIPCHINSYYINDILKGELGFQGVVISDFSDVEFLIDAHQVAKDKREATKLAVNAGLDLIMNPYDIDIIDIIIDLVDHNEISIERINDAVTRVLRLKFYLNLFEHPYSNPNDFPDVGSEEHIAANYAIAAESITLLKNENNVLPLSKEKKVFVTGYSANSINILNGAWSRSFLGRDTMYNDPRKLTILDAISSEIGSKNVSYLEGTDYLTDINTEKTIALAKQADYIVVCVGEIPATEVPSNTNELELPLVQQELIKSLSKANKPIIMLMVQGRPRIIREIEPLVDGIMMAYLPGQEGGKAISDVLYGNINPSAKLPYTYPKYSGFVLPYYHKKTDVRDVNWGFNGFEPQYHFGFGLSYASFEYSNLKLSSDTLAGKNKLLISIDVKNASSLEGKEVVQCYIKDLVASIAPDSKKLVAFKKVQLNSQETKTLEFEINIDDLSFVDSGNRWVAESGDFQVQIGGDPTKLMTANFNYSK